MIDEAKRRELWGSLRDLLGESPADTLMTMLPVQPLPELATREDLLGLRAELRSEIRAQTHELRAETAELATGLRTVMADVRVDVAELRGEMLAEFGRLRAGMARQFYVVVGMIIAVLGTVLSLGFGGAFG